MDLGSLLALDPETLRCPYPLYEQAREEGIAYDKTLGAYVASRHEDAVAILRDAAGFSSSEVLGRPLPPPDEAAGQVAPLLLVTDDPEHAAKRGLVARAFTPRQMRRFEAAVAELCDQLIDPMLEADQVDFVADFAAPLPIRVVTTVLGVPKGDADLFRHWSEEVTSSLGGHETSPDRRQEAGERFRQLVDELLEDRSGLDPESVLGAIAEAEAAGTLTRFESVRLVMELIVAGNITTTDHLANSVMLLAGHPEIADQLRSDPSLVPAFVEESLRMEPPVQGFYRRCVEARDVGGVSLAPGDRMLVLYGSANRDDRRFEAPDQLRLDRAAPTSHIAFGFGTHTCLGAPLARMEGRIALETLLGRTRSFSLAEPSTIEPLASYINHGPSRLLMHFEPAALDEVIHHG